MARHDARVNRSGQTVVDHPLVGQLQLGYGKLPIPDTDGQILAIYRAADTASTSRLALLAAITSGRWESRRAPPSVGGGSKPCPSPSQPRS